MKIFDISYDLLLENNKTVHIVAKGHSIEIYECRFSYVDLYSGSRLTYWFPKEKHFNQSAKEISNIQIREHVHEIL